MVFIVFSLWNEKRGNPVREKCSLRPYRRAQLKGTSWDSWEPPHAVIEFCLWYQET